MAIATSTAIAIGLAAGTAGAGVASAKIQSNAAGKAAKLATTSANYSADVQSKSNADALAFQKQQAAQDLATANATQRANYDQWAARESRLGSLGEMVGLGPRSIPGYVPITGADGAPGPGGGGTATLDASKGDLAAQISGFFTSKGVSDHETPYWVSKWPELLARGQQIGDPAYALKRLGAADVLGGAGGGGSVPTSTKTATPYTSGSLGAMISPQTQQPLLTPALQAPETTYAGSLGSLARRRYV